MKSKREEQLESIIRDIMWMARRYADGRSTYAPNMFNRAMDLCIDLGVNVKPDGPDQKIYADDGMLGKYDPKTKTFYK